MIAAASTIILLLVVLVSYLYGRHSHRREQELLNAVRARWAGPDVPTNGARSHAPHTLVMVAVVGAVLTAWSIAHAGDAGPAADAGAAPAGALDGEQFLRQVWEAFAGRHWPALAALAVVGIVWAVRKLAVQRLPWVATDRGGAVLAMVTATGLAIAGALASGLPVLDAVLRGVVLGWTAVGGFTWVKRILDPKDAPIVELGKLK